MGEILTAILSIGGMMLIGYLKPEWLVGWLLKLLDKKLPNKSNNIENSLGIKAIETGVYIIKAHPDSDKMSERSIKVIDSSLEVLKDELKNQ
jgi:hypothetical protein